MSKETNEASEKVLVEQVIKDCIMWPYPEKNPDRLRGSLAQDSSFFIYHPDAASTIRGYDNFEKLIQTVFLSDKLKATGTEISDLEINIAASGEVAWFRCILQDHGEWEGKAYKWKDCRWTGVLVKRDGKWLIVHAHFSTPSAGQGEGSSV